MKGIFDKNCFMTGWIDQVSMMIFNMDMKWIAYVVEGNVFSTSQSLLGAYIKGTFVDKKGHPVAWVEGAHPIPTGVLSRPLTPLKPLSPLTPLMPLRPLQPLRPLTPVGGWSLLNWNDYINQGKETSSIT